MYRFDFNANRIFDWNTNVDTSNRIAAFNFL